MLKAEIASLFSRDLDRLITEVEQYPTESSLWTDAPGIANSGGNLVLHLVGNLNHFIGAMLGQTGYIRKRDQEFTDKFVPKSDLIKQLTDTKEMIASTLENLTNEHLDKAYPLEVLNKRWATREFLLHLAGHLNYHMGQINYHRRLMAK